LHSSFEKLLKRGVDDLESPKRYFFRIIKNEFLDRYRKRKKLSFTEYHDDSNIVQLNGSQLEDLIIDRDQVDRIMEDIKPEERELLYLSVVEGFSVTEISEISGTPRGTLLSKLHRLKLKLKNKFQASTAEKTG
jgi:RNA polymerase sigma-70 factor (ECF subfamily)